MRAFHYQSAGRLRIDRNSGKTGLGILGQRVAQVVDQIEIGERRDLPAIAHLGGENAHGEVMIGQFAICGLQLTITRRHLPESPLVLPHAHPLERHAELVFRGHEPIHADARLPIRTAVAAKVAATLVDHPAIVVLVAHIQIQREPVCWSESHSGGHIDGPVAEFVERVAAYRARLERY